MKTVFKLEVDPVAVKTAYRTRQQEELLGYLKATPGEHHTVAQIRDHFSFSDRPIGTTTIYRHLERLVDDGSVKKYVLETGDCACYEYVQEAGNCGAHFHCKCEKCGRLIHLDCDELCGIREHLKGRHGFIWDSGKTVFYGICENCAAEK